MRNDEKNELITLNPLVGLQLLGFRLRIANYEYSNNNYEASFLALRQSRQHIL